MSDNYDEGNQDIQKDIHFGVAVVIEHKHVFSFDWRELGERQAMNTV